MSTDNNIYIYTTNYHISNNIFVFIDILLLDEPTTGLDSYNARHLVTNLAQLAHDGKIVLLSIHQPRSDIFALCDQIGILSHGNLVYYGGRDQLVDYFTSIGYPCPQFTNPLDRYGKSVYSYIPLFFIFIIHLLFSALLPSVYIVAK
jgi:hypothetical protein